MISEFKIFPLNTHQREDDNRFLNTIHVHQCSMLAENALDDPVPFSFRFVSGFVSCFTNSQFGSGLKSRNIW